MNDQHAPASSVPVEVTEVRLLEGPNLYFTRPAVKVSLSLPGYLAADAAALRSLAGQAGLRRSRPGRPGTSQRQRFVMRVVERAVRVTATAAGTSRLGVRSRPGGDPELVVASFVWRHRGRAKALGEALGPVLTAWLQDALEGTDTATAVLAEQAQRVEAAAAGARPATITPKVPVVSITGTNGKTTTTRMVAHMAMTAGLTTSWSSTDGVMAQGVMVEEGDFSGPAGARAVLATPGLQLGILETARGGMLLKGVGVSANDVSVVTNVSADHLGLQGIDTVDQLAEVKAIVTRITKPSGWVVLNGDDPRVWAMRTRIKARPWAFSLDPNSPALRESAWLNGRGATVMDGHITVLDGDRDPDRLAKVVDVPMTLSGLSRHNVANALAATAAALAIGIPREAVVAGLKSFAPDYEHNPGRMNTWSYPAPGGGVITVIADLAHNEAGLEALMDVAHGLKFPGGRVHLGLGLAGDRTDELLESIGEYAGLRADRVVAAHKEHYLRGRTMDDLEHHLRIGLARAGVPDIDSYDTELEALEGLLPGAADGDVVALMCHTERAEIADWLRARGATNDDAKTIRRKVVAARGEHEFEAEIAALHEDQDRDRAVAAARELAEAHPRDVRLAYEHASALDSAGKAADAAAQYQAALDGGLREPHRHRARIQLASSLRVLGHPAEALEILDQVAAERPGDAAVAMFRALVLVDLGQERVAVADLIGALLAHAAEDDAQTYRRALTAYAEHLA